MKENIATVKKDELSIIDIISVIWRARKFIVISSVISISIGIMYILFATKMYIGKITLYPAQQGQTSPMAAISRQIGIVGASVGDANYNIPDVVKSRTLSEQIVAHEWQIEGYDKKIDLVDYFDKLNKVRRPEWVQTKQDEDKWHQIKLYSYSESIARDRISVSANAKTGLVSISVKMEDPILAKDIANFISVFVSNWVNKTQIESIRKNLEFIYERSTVLGTELQEAENELKKFRETNRNILNSPDLQLELQRLQRQVTIKQEVYLTMIKQREINQIDENKSVDVIRILDKAIEKRNPVVPNKKNIIIFSFVIGNFISLIIIYLILLMMKKTYYSNYTNKLYKIIFSSN